MHPTAARNRVTQLAPTDFDAALTLARTIKDPWFRCQSLADAARHGPERAVLKIIGESLSAAWEANDPYKTVAVVGWPLRALIERDRAAQVEELLPQILDHAQTIAHPVSRLEALFTLWNAIYPLGGELRQRVQGALVVACQAAKSWKAGDRLAYAAQILAGDKLEEAMTLVALLREGRVKRRTLRKIEAGKFEAVRRFF